MKLECKEPQTVLNELLQQQKLGVLATTAADTPHTSIVAFACSIDQKNVYFGTPIATLKFRNIEQNARVVLLIDNRQNLAEDFSEAAAVSCVGKAAILKEQQREEACTLLSLKHPELKHFFTAPTCALISISVEKYSLVVRFQEVIEFRVTTEK